MQTESVAIVTGASQGIGRATAIRLARDFEAVVLSARQEDELKKTAADVRSSGAEAGIARYGEPEEIAGLMAYLLSKKARWLTAASVRMDGGEIKGL